MNVPFVDLQAQHSALREDLDQAIRGVMEHAHFALGEDVDRFEEEFAAHCDARYAVGVDSGLSALKLSLRALGIGPGDEVIVPAHTFIATAAAVTFAGADPVLVDVDPTTYNIDVAAIERAITSRTRGIIPVHLYGLPADMGPILELAEEHGLVVVEDACQAHGATYQGQRVGSLGDAGAFSFYPTKNLGACGDAGIVVTNDEEAAERILAMRNCGQWEKYRHELAPYNHRLDTLQAAILRVKLRHLEDWIEARRRHAAHYSELLTESEVALPVELPDAVHAYHLYVVRTRQRDALRAHLWDQGVGTGIHYPIPVHRQPFYTRDGLDQGPFPVTERLSDEVLSLPLFPEMTADQVEYVARQVAAFPT